MTDEEKAIDYADTECCNSCTSSCTNKEKNNCCEYCNTRNAVLYGLKEGRESFAKELVERVNQDQAKRQIQTINVLELKEIINQMGVN